MPIQLFSAKKNFLNFDNARLSFVFQTKEYLKGGKPFEIIRQFLIFYGGNLNEKENNIIYINDYGTDDGIFTRRL